MYKIISILLIVNCVSVICLSASSVQRDKRWANWRTILTPATVFPNHSSELKTVDKRTHNVHTRSTSLNQNCGVSSALGIGLIVNGQGFDRGKWPWMVALMKKRKSEPPRFFCGGTLVSATRVLTGKEIIKLRYFF